ncbi:MAG: hypothetical protein AB7D05_00045 [Mangrovibacterium sp.]
MRSLLLLVFFLLLQNLPVSAQYFTTGEDPARIRWNQLETSNFQLIFPRGYEHRAVMLAGKLEQVYACARHSLSYSPKKIPIILHTHTAASNGLVAWAPRRAEFYTTPHQQIYAQDWLEQLVVHEFRHVVQLSAVETELPAVFRWLLGEQAAALVVGAYLPFWLLEGDAVMTETVLGRAGRGRQPSFLMEHKAQLLEKGIYSYDKASLGSYRNYVPNIYRFGYLFAGELRRQYGPKIWSDVFKETGSRPLSLNPLNRILRRYTGYNKKQLYEQIFRQYAREWQADFDTLQLSQHHPAGPSRSGYTNYRCITALNDSCFVALKESRMDIDRIVMIQQGKERIIHTPGQLAAESLSVTDSLVIWSELRSDIRWAHARRTVIVLLDLQNGAVRELYPENLLFSPVIAPGHKIFAAVEKDTLDHYRLGLYDLRSGVCKARYASPEKDYFLTPDWDDDSRMLCFVGLCKTGKYLGLLDTETGVFSKRCQPGYHDIRNPEFVSGKIFYTSAYTGTDNIYCFQPGDSLPVQLSSVRYGADYPSIKGKKLFFSDYSSDGYGVSVLELPDILPVPKAQPEPARYGLAEALAAQEKEKTDFSECSDSCRTIKPYGKLSHLFQLHSWAPLYLDANDYELRPGFSLLSQNTLGTALAVAGYRYDPSENSGKIEGELEYSGLFPVIRGKLSYGNRKSVYRQIRKTTDEKGTVICTDTLLQRFGWKEFEWEMNVRVPLNFSRGKYNRLLQPEVEYAYERISHERSTPGQFVKGAYHALSYRLYLQNKIRMAELDLIPAWGQSLELQFRHSPAGAVTVGSLKSAETGLCFPGLIKNHGIRLYGGWQKKENTSGLNFQDAVRFPRGYSRMQNNKLISAGADYLFPLCYPDLSLGSLFFLKRLRVALFYDYARVKSALYDEEGVCIGNMTSRLNSLGAELRADGHLLRLVAPVSAGLRGIYRPYFGDFRFELMVSASFGVF